MSKYMVLMNYNGEEMMLDEFGTGDDAVFDTEDEAIDAALEASSCAREGANILHLSNPGDYPDDYDSYEVDYEILEVDD